VLLEGESDVAMEVEFGQGVRGNHVAEGARVGLAFFVENGGILGKGAVTVNLSAPNRKPRAPALSRAACFDVDGEEIADVQLTFDH
jgi:hypothetical protein